ncbi:BDM_1a_G0052720.mRNA.1.CDS.1 [Saccharomyces cerevisiae]|nr:BDM_1a_G0052720.mRNA.1.CDS.1 [Saccharomyces cerevisiae]CAI7364557.1 BDM_1a_G0052720.mRNA.1.CDS.1 [Saccharomyces cerevisiae]
MYGKLPLVLTDACMGVLGEVTWEYRSDDLYSSPACTYEPALQSMLYCIYESLNEKGYSNKTFEKTFAAIKEDCAYYTDNLQNMTNTDFYNMLNNGTTYIVQYYEGSANLTYPIEMDAQVREKYYYSYHGFYANYDIGHTYGGIICAYFVGVMILASILHYLSYTPFKTALFKQRLVRYVRRYFTLPTIWGKHASSFSYLKIFTGFLPTRSEGVIILGYLVLHTVFLAYGYQYDPYNLIFDSRREQVARYVADRSGVLAFAHFPLIVLFDGKNSTMTWLTGIRYTTFITYHKWLGRFMLVDCTIHAIGYTYHAYIENYWKYVKYSDLWTSGRHAVIIFGVLVFFSFFFFRRHYYELFVITHIILAIGFFHACWKHCYKLGWGEWIMACALFWFADRIVRLIKIAIFGMPWAKLKLCGESMIEVRISKSSKWWKAEPGQYIYLYFLRPKIFWQSHPFTVMDSLVEDGELVVVITVKNGLTKKLQEYLLESEGYTEMRVLAEGPYGQSTRTHLFESLLFIAGGAGVPGPLSMAIKAGRQVKSNDSHQMIKFVWSVRNLDLLEVYRKEIMVLKELNIDTKIYFTGERKDESNTEEGAIANMSTEGRLLTTSKSAEMITDFGRPNIDEIIEEAVSGAKSLLVTCCGSEGFVDKTRELTAKRVLEHADKWIEYVEEFQNW